MTTRTQRFTIAAAVLGLALAGQVALPAGTAQAACTPALDIGLTIKSGTQVKGSGSYTKCSSTDPNWYWIEITLEEQQGLLWARRSSVTLRPAALGSAARTVSASCAGHGTDNWRTVITRGPDNGTRSQTKVSNVLRVTC